VSAGAPFFRRLYPNMSAAGIIAVVLVALVVLAAALLWRRSAARSVLGGARAWWDAPASPPAQKKIRAYAQRSIVPSLRPSDRKAFSRHLSRALKGRGLGGLRKVMRRSALAGAAAGRGDSGRAQARARKIVGLLPKGASGPYLDLGCGDGSITVAVGEALGAPCPTCVEVGSPPPGFPESVRRVDAAEMGELPAGRFGVVTALMSLHHVPDAKKAVAEVARLVRPGGSVVIREHDLGAAPRSLTPRGAREYLDWVHILYDLAESGEPAPRAEYRPPKEWRSMFADAGLTSAGRAPGNTDRVFSYYEVFSAPAPSSGRTKTLGSSVEGSPGVAPGFR